MPSLRTLIILVVVVTGLLAVAPAEQIRQIPVGSEILLDAREWIRDTVTQIFHSAGERLKDFIKLFIGDVFEDLQQSLESSVDDI